MMRNAVIRLGIVMSAAIRMPDHFGVEGDPEPPLRISWMDFNSSFASETREPCIQMTFLKRLFRIRVTMSLLVSDAEMEISLRQILFKRRGGPETLLHALNPVRPLLHRVKPHEPDFHKSLFLVFFCNLLCIGHGCKRCR